jgi:sporulation protein YlmC with PRC-barrel domain
MGSIVDADRFPAHRRRRQRHRTRVLAIVLASCGAIGLFPPIVRSDVVVVDVVAVAKGQRTEDLKGKPVLNEKNEKIGTVDDLIIGHDRVLFAILQVGGFLGIGSHFVAVPYQSLQIQEPGKILLPGASKEALQSLPEFKYHV